MMRTKILALAAVALGLAPIAAQAANYVNAATGVSNGLHWTAASTVIGQTSTATVAGGGNPIYLGQTPQYRSTVGILMNYGADGNYVCSGSLSENRSSIITAAHCVNILGRRPDSTTVFFYDGNILDQPVYNAGAAGVTTVGVSGVHVNPLYTGNVIDQNDIAVLNLAGGAAAVPAFAQGYALYTQGDLTGVDYNIAGYGRRSNAGGSVGVNLGTGRLRQGNNRYDFRLGDADFNGLFTPAFFGEPAGAQTAFSYLADFDNGLPANDASCGLSMSNQFGLPGLAAGPKYCNLGRGALEVSTAGGDSGGPQFVNGKLASVTSYGLTFGQDIQPGDIDNALNDTFGEFNGFVPIFIHTAFIAANVPEPATWALMIGGFGLVGASARRARMTKVAS